MNETAKEAAKRFAGPKLAHGFVPVALHVYHDKEGKQLFWRIRAKHPDTGEKWIRPMRLTVGGYELGEPDFAGGKPLYAMQRISSNPDSTIELVEGEMCADKLNALGLVATTSGGATSAGTVNADILRGRTIRIWPDHDQAGQKYANDWAAILTELGCSFTIIDAAALGLPEGGDCVDWLAAHPEADSGAIESLPREKWQSPLNNAPEALVSRGRTVTLLSASDIEPEPICWIWKDWLAAGKFHILGGAPGTGKTTLAIALAATVSCGGQWPDGTRAEAGKVLIWSGEDDPANTLVPRLIASGANLERVKFVVGTDGIEGKRPFDPAKNMDALRDAALALGNVNLLIVDPVVSAVAGDSHKNAETRKGLQPLVDLGAALGCAVLGITHFSKGTVGRDPTERITGSLAFAALARVVMVAAKKNQTEDGEATRIFARSKSNIGPDDGGFAYDLQQSELAKHLGVFASHVAWAGSIDGTAREMLASADVSDDEDGGELGNARAFLIDLLQYGEMSVKEVQKAAGNAGLAFVTVKRAKKSAGVESVKGGMHGGWVWRISRRGSTNSEEDQQNNAIPFEKNDPLRTNSTALSAVSEIF